MNYYPMERTKALLVNAPGRPCVFEWPGLECLIRRASSACSLTELIRCHHLGQTLNA
jgi:hypothetical protein